MTIQEKLASLGPEIMEEIPVTKENIFGFFNNAEKFLDFSRFNIKQHKSDWENQIFTILYNAMHLGFTSLLALYGYKTTSAGGHHINTFGFGGEILIKETDKIVKDIEIKDKIRNRHSRIERIIKDRKQILYDASSAEISRTDLLSMFNDVEYLLNRIKIVINKSNLK